MLSGVAIHAALLARTEPARKGRVRQTLARYLTPSDLALPDARLSRRLAAVGRASGLFAMPAASGYFRPLARVRGGERERIVLLATNGDADMVPMAGFWIGSRRSRVAAVALPDSIGSLEGPLVGEWRRRGAYLLAAGFSRAFHSPAFTEGVFLAFSEDRNGLRLLQSGRNEFVKAPIGFRSRRSDDLISRAEDDSDFRTLEGFRATSLTRQTLWRFRGGHYHAASRILHDRLWAFDRLATAIRLGRGAEVARTIPDPIWRKRIVREVRRALARGERLIVDDGETLSLLEVERETESPFRLRFGMMHGRWVVTSVERIAPR